MAVEPPQFQGSLSEATILPQPERDGKTTKSDVATVDSEVQFTKDFGFLPIPPHLRYDPSKPAHFGVLLNIVFGITTTFTVANLYYCQPLLIQFSQSFNVSYNEVSRIPTLIQAGYAIGLLLIAPLGDLVRRRQLILLIMTLSAGLSIGLAITRNLIVFEILSFLIGIVTVTPQILLPLAADLAPPERRSTAIAVVWSGLLFGILIARVFSGIIGDVTTWRVVYYFAIGIQFVVIAGCYFIIPDYSAKNQGSGLTYFKILKSMGVYSVTEPSLIQASLINMSSMACFSNFWVTLTFLLGGPPYFYSTLVIGLFGLIGMAGVALGPGLGQLMDKLVRQPWYASLFSIIMLSIFQAIQVGAGGINVGAVIVSTFGLDVFRQMLQVSLSTTILSIAPEARARLNSVALLAVFIGQVMGTSVGTKVFIKYGWRAGAALNMAWYGWMLFVLLVRGPFCARYTWLGYEGGLSIGRETDKTPDLMDESKIMNTTDVKKKDTSSEEQSSIEIDKTGATKKR